MKRTVIFIVVVLSLLTGCKKGWIEESSEGGGTRMRGHSSSTHRDREQSGSMSNDVLYSSSSITKNGAYDTLKYLWPTGSTVDPRSLAQLAARLTTHYGIDWGVAAQSSELVLDGLKSSVIPNHEIGLIFAVDLLDFMAFDYENERAPVFDDLWYQFSYGWDNFHEVVQLNYNLNSTQNVQPDTSELSRVLTEWVDDMYMMVGLDWDLFKDSKDLIDQMENVDVLEAEDWVVIMSFDLLAYLEGEAIFFHELWENVLSYNWTQKAYLIRYDADR